MRATRFTERATSCVSADRPAGADRLVPAVCRTGRFAAATASIASAARLAHAVACIVASATAVAAIVGAAECKDVRLAAMPLSNKTCVTSLDPRGGVAWRDG